MRNRLELTSKFYDTKFTLGKFSFPVFLQLTVHSIISATHCTRRQMHYSQLLREKVERPTRTVTKKPTSN
jgi:hypothetical protein